MISECGTHFWNTSRASLGVRGWMGGCRRPSQWRRKFLVCASTQTQKSGGVHAAPVTEMVGLSAARGWGAEDEDPDGAGWVMAL